MKRIAFGQGTAPAVPAKAKIGGRLHTAFRASQDLVAQ